MTDPGHNNPPVVLELTREEAEFMLRNAEANIAHGMCLLEQREKLSEAGLHKVVELIESFKPLRAKLKKVLD